ncbi:ninjurin-A isoform X3 [Vanessa cardui]|uniref:ninjurin-A isoform X3 n=1 Tax=Vanessa cardui TaxID=171605 RepID=UPI001F13E281|nr:ninjurin-A isoform X3 [Vanessa cardui]
MSTEGHVLNHRMETPGFHRAPKTLDVNDVEMIFGTPASPRGRIQPDVHLISNEKTNGRDKLPNNNKSDGSDSTLSSQPLLEPDKDRPKPPLAGPEIDDLDDEQPNEATPYPGIDDGLLEPNNNKPAVNGEGDEGKSDGGSHHTHPTRDDGVGTEDDLNGFGPRFGIDDRPGSPMMPGSIPDVNTYQQKKNLAQGMMDLALLSANANQLRYVLESSSTHPYYYPSLTFISLSIIFQIAVGVGLIMNSRYNVKDDKDICKADKINNMTVLGVFLVTIVNVFITSFSVATPTTIANMGNSIQQAG